MEYYKIIKLINVYKIIGNLKSINPSFNKIICRHFIIVFLMDALPLSLNHHHHKDTIYLS